jgi:hypothetical protein
MVGYSETDPLPSKAFLSNLSNPALYCAHSTLVDIGPFAEKEVIQ